MYSVLANTFNRAIHENIKAEATTQKTEVATDYAIHGNLIDWLQNSGRLISYPSVDYYYEDEGDEEEYVEELVDSFDFDAEAVEDFRRRMKLSTNSINHCWWIDALF